jgi:cysteine sulfinate desulfinase/cysteine desulfurase-like protein
VYPDCNGTTPLAPRVAESMRPYLTDFDADDLIADLTQVLDAG